MSDKGPQTPFDLTTARVNGTKIYCIVVAMLALYVVPPVIAFQNLDFTIFPYNSYLDSSDFKNIAGETLLALVVAMWAILYKKEFTLRISKKQLNRITAITLAGTIAATAPLIVHLLAYGTPENRTESYLVFERFRSNIFWVSTSNAYLVAGLVNAMLGKPKHLVLYAILALAPELALGSRITTLRFLIAALAILPLNAKKLSITAGLLAIAFFSRAIFQGQEFSFEPQGLVLSIGELLNTFLGANLVYQATGEIPCSAIGGLLRALIPPPLRAASPALSDFTTCINERYFDNFDLMGLAGSPISDRISSPVTFYAICTAIVAIGVWLHNKRTISVGYGSTYTLIMFITCIPYLPRWGLVGGISFALSFSIWYLTPLVYITQVPRKTKRDNREKSPTRDKCFPA